MNELRPNRKRVVVIGGGITGLAAAHRVVELNPTLDVTLLEAGPRLGGVLETVRRDGFLIERSADNFITDVPWAVDLCRRIGFFDQLIPTASGERNAMVVRRGRLERIPRGFMLLAPSRIWPLVTTPILSPWGKLRLLGELFVSKRTSDEDESLGAFARRRLGREAFERIVQPLVGGIYTADPEKLSLRATLPRFIEMERRDGSLIRGGRRQRRAAPTDGSTGGGARYGLFVTPRDGLTSLVEAIALRLPEGSIKLNAPVERIACDSTGTWQVSVSGTGHPPETIACQGLIVAIGAEPASRLLADVDQQLAADLRGIPSAGTVIVSLAYRRNQIAHALDGFGFVVPALEKRRILAGSFASVKFTGRAPHDTVLVRVFIGGACQSELLELSDDHLREIASEELRELLGTSGAPLLGDVARWPHSMPQYHLGHGQRVDNIEQAASRLKTLELAGNAYHGVGIPNCIHSGEVAAERLCTALT